MVDREFEVIVDEKLSSKGKSFLVATVVGETGKAMARVSLARESDPWAVSVSLHNYAGNITSPETRELVEKAAKAVPGLK